MFMLSILLLSLNVFCCCRTTFTIVVMFLCLLFVLFLGLVKRMNFVFVYIVFFSVLSYFFLSFSAAFSVSDVVVWFVCSVVVLVILFFCVVFEILCV